MAKMNDTELLRILDDESKQTLIYKSDIAEDRDRSLRAYMRKPYGNEEEGRSQVVTSDVFDAVEGMLPDLIDVFMASDKAVIFEPVGQEDVDGAEQATNACNYVFYKQNNGFLILYSAFKDALMMKTGGVKWYWEKKRVPTFTTYKNVEEMQLAAFLEKNPKAEIMEQEETEPSEADLAQFQQESAMMYDATGVVVDMPKRYNIKVKTVEEKGVCRIVAIPPEEMRVSNRHNSLLLDECPYVAHVTQKSVSDIRQMGYKIDADDVRNAQAESDSIESRERRENGDYPTHNDETDDESQVRGWLRDEYILVDYDGDGISERRRIVRLGDMILENKEVSHVPMAMWSPYMLTHQCGGFSVAELVEDFQRMHTTILRNQFDNLALANNQETVVLTDNQGNPLANIDDLLNRRPGGILREKQGGAIRPYSQQWQGIQAMPMLEQLQSEKENRTGWTRYSQGLDGDSLNKTKGGMQMIMNASQKRMKLMARNAAECLVSPMFKGIFKTLTDNCMDKLSYRLNGNFVAYDPQEWRDQYDMTINVGIGTGDEQQQSQFLLQIAQAQATVAGSPYAKKLISPKQIYNVQARLAENAGFKNANEFWLDPDKVPDTPPGPPPIDPKILLEQAKLKDGQQKSMAEMQMGVQKQDKELAFKAQQAELDRLSTIEIEELKLASAERIEGMKLMSQTAEVTNSPEVTDPMPQMMQQLMNMMALQAAPKRIIRDNNGRAIGVEPVMPTEDN